jgi:uncharacterized protein (DUF169 family)
MKIIIDNVGQKGITIEKCGDKVYFDVQGVEETIQINYSELEKVVNILKDIE